MKRQAVKLLSGTWKLLAILCLLFCLQRQLDSESSKVSSKKAMEKIEMLQNRRQEVNNNIIMVSLVPLHSVCNSKGVCGGSEILTLNQKLIFFFFHLTAETEHQ